MMDRDAIGLAVHDKSNEIKKDRLYLWHRLRSKLTGFEPPAHEALTRHQFPGNVRELENVVERAVITSVGPRLNLARALPDPQLAAHALQTAATFICSEQDAMDQMQTLRILGEAEAAMQEVQGYGLPDGSDDVS